MYIDNEYYPFYPKIRDEDIGKSQDPIANRRLTWCDIFYRAAVEATKNSHILITRYPINRNVGGFSQ